jgi:hypothetical protein
LPTTRCHTKRKGKNKNANMLCVLLLRPEEINQLASSTIIYLRKVPRSQRNGRATFEPLKSLTHSLKKLVEIG